MVYLKKKNIIQILRGTDFEGNDLTGRRAEIINIITPDTIRAHIRVEGMDHDMFFPKNDMKLIERPIALKPKKSQFDVHKFYGGPKL
jgi:hypothetical protein